MTQPGFPPDVIAPLEDPLLEVARRLRSWFVSPRIVALLAQMKIVQPSVGYCALNEREQILNQGQGQANRVLLMPGSWPDGSNHGELVAVQRRKGLFHRVNATWERIFTVSTWAADTTAPGGTHDKEKQLQAASSLMNTTHAGLSEILAGDFPGTGSVFRDPKASANLSFGEELLAQYMFRCEMRGMPQNVSGTPVTVELTPKS